MNKSGADAFRFTLAAFAAQGRDIKLSEKRIEGYRNFMNKIWNSARFALPHLEGLKGDLGADDLESLTLPERWILSRLNHTIRQTHEAIQGYRFNEAANALYQFTWHEFCDWFIEASKLPLTGDDDVAAKRSAMVLKHTLDALMRLLHPIVPFITEEIASRIPGAEESIMKGPFPSFDRFRIDNEAEAQMETLMGLITSVRNIRAEMDIAPSRSLPVIIETSDDASYSLFQLNRKLIGALGRIESMDLRNPGKAVNPPRMSATSLVGANRIFVPLEGIVDPDAEIARLDKEINKIGKELAGVENKLGNESFLEKANPEAIEKQRVKKANLKLKMEGFAEALDKMRRLKSE
jgi:valyl-tRNA synthetase